MKSTDLLEKIAERYFAPAHALLSQVRSATGHGDVRTADALVMSLWPSRGLHLHGFEIKVSRGDWLRELKDPAKAEEIVRFCDFWWIVADRGIVEKSELPPTWGLLEASGRGGSLKVIVDAPKLEANMPDRSFLASLCRNVAEGFVAKDLIKGQIEAATAAGVERGGWRMKELQENVGDLNKVINEFETASGVRIRDPWTHTDDIGKTVRDVLAGKHRDAQDALKKLKVSAANIAKFIDGELKKYEL